MMIKDDSTIYNKCFFYNHKIEVKELVMGNIVKFIIVYSYKWEEQIKKLGS